MQAPYVENPSSRREKNHILTSIAINVRQNMWTGNRKSCNDYVGFGWSTKK